MPGVQFSLTDLESLLGRSVPRDKEGLNEIFAFVKGDVDSLEGDLVSIEVKDSNRPDIWAVEGIARVLKSQLGYGKTREVRLTGPSSLKVVIDKRVKPIRPFISTAIVKGLHPTDEMLKGWISLQEKMDQTYGRRRKRASIGLYQADLISSPLSYTVADPDKIEFAPLGTETKFTLRKIVADQPKGQEYGEIISGFHEWPILVDSEERVLSLPPVINSNDLGRVTTETKNVLVEVTGTNSETVHNTLKIIVSTLAERGGKIYSCVETYGSGSPRRVVSPDLAYSKSRLSLSSVNRLLGASISGRDVSRLLEKAGYRVKRITGDIVNVEIPCYRTDIMHSVDIIEDIAIAMDLNKLEPEWPTIWTIGDLTPKTVETERLGEIMIGLGFQETLTYVLTSPETLNEKMQTDNHNLVKLANPKMSTHTAMRNWLLPSLLEFLSKNTHVDYPQKIFEVGSSVNRDENDQEQVLEERRIAGVTIHSGAGFTEIRSTLDALMKATGRTFTIKPGEHPSFLTGRCGAIMAEGLEIGVIGEIHPRVLQNWGLSLPAAALEVDVTSGKQGVSE